MGTMLRGITVGITADRRWDEQAALFERRGAQVIHAATIRTIPLGSDAPLREATDAVIARPVDVFVANTGIGVRTWLAAADSWGLGADLLNSLAKSRIIARGPKASMALKSAGLGVDARAASERLLEAVELALDGLANGSTVALQVDGSGNSRELTRLRSEGMNTVVVPVYEWRMPVDDGPVVELVNALIQGTCHAVTFTTGPSIRNLMGIAAEHGLDADLRAALTNGRTVVGVVGPVCAEAAIQHGLASESMVMPDSFRLAPLVRVVVDRLLEMPPPGAHPLHAE